MPREIIAFDGSKHLVDCLGCLDKSSLQIPGLQPVYEDQFFKVHQDFEVPIPGMMVLETRRHIQSLLDFNLEEHKYYFHNLGLVRAAMFQELGLTIGKVSTHQDESSPHFHTYLFPHYSWMDQLDKKQRKSIRPVMDYAVNFRDAAAFAGKNMRNLENFREIDEAAKKLRSWFSDRM